MVILLIYHVIYVHIYINFAVKCSASKRYIFMNVVSWSNFWSLLYAFFRVIPRHLNFICWRFRTLRLFHLHAPTCLWRWNRQSVPKRRHIKFRCRESPKRKHTTFRTRRKFEIKKLLITCRNSFTNKLHVIELHDYSLVKWLGNAGAVVLSQMTLLSTILMPLFLVFMLLMLWRFLVFLIVFTFVRDCLYFLDPFSMHWAHYIGKYCLHYRHWCVLNYFYGDTW